MPKKVKHFCLRWKTEERTVWLDIDKEWNILENTNLKNFNTEQNRWGEAFEYCYSVDNKKGYITNWEYESEVRFCPVCWFEFVNYQK